MYDMLVLYSLSSSRRTHSSLTLNVLCSSLYSFSLSFQHFTLLSLFSLYLQSKISFYTFSISSLPPSLPQKAFKKYALFKFLFLLQEEVYGLSCTHTHSRTRLHLTFSQKQKNDHAEFPFEVALSVLGNTLHNFCVNRPLSLYVLFYFWRTNKQSYIQSLCKLLAVLLLYGMKWLRFCKILAIQKKKKIIRKYWVN